MRISGLQCANTFMTAVPDSKAIQGLPLRWKYIPTEQVSHKVTVY